MATTGTTAAVASDDCACAAASRHSAKAKVLAAMAAQNGRKGVRTARASEVRADCEKRRRRKRFENSCLPFTPCRRAAASPRARAPRASRPAPPQAWPRRCGAPPPQSRLPQPLHRDALPSKSPAAAPCLPQSGRSWLIQTRASVCTMSAVALRAAAARWVELLSGRSAARQRPQASKPVRIEGVCALLRAPAACRLVR